MKNIAILHQIIDSNSEAFNAPDAQAVWTTCRRQIGFQWIKINQNALCGPDAHQLLLEVVCGLKSPVIGETEVHGQYKQFLEDHKNVLPKNIYSDLFSVHLQAREIRDKYLRGLGTQSYGSYARKKLKGHSDIVVWGAGHLAKKILPWLVKTESQIRLWVRSKERAIFSFEQFPNIIIEELAYNPNAQKGALVLAAPIPSEVVSSHLDKLSWTPDIILDFRGESHKDPLPAEYEALSLENIFSEIQNVKLKINERIDLARQEIQQIVQSGLNENYHSRT